MKEIVLLVGAGQIGMAIARRIGFGKTILVGDKSIDNATTIAKVLKDADFEAQPMSVDIAFRASV